jgi:hypothetical protein
MNTDYLVMQWGKGGERESTVERRKYVLLCVTREKRLYAFDPYVKRHRKRKRKEDE